MESDLGSSGVVNEPPRIPKYRGAANVNADDQIPEEEPFAYEWLPGIPWRYTHNGVVGRIKSESGGR